ncbi:hypothetical protein FQA39_LY18705 [Lamprigera yunnana]|nr:hypothetical protein FQA39_LY18705 [Lamprigera yunnana]
MINSKSVKGSLEGIVVGSINLRSMPNADKLRRQQSKGANSSSSSCRKQKIYDKTGLFLKLKKQKLEVKFLGMICAEDELGLSEDHGGIMVLDETQYEVGKICRLFELNDDEVIEIGLTPQ